MTLVDRPLIQYAIDEARAAGIEEFIFVTSRGKGALEDYFDHAHELESNLKKANKTDLLDVLRAPTWIRAPSPISASTRRWVWAMRSGARAVWCGDEPFAVILTDDVIMGEPPCLQQMIEAYQETGGSMVATMEVPLEKTKSYGVLDVAEDMGAIVRPRAWSKSPRKTRPRTLR
jgi:UTP--glucose-1-phosphate uridylyltransferase